MLSRDLQRNLASPWRGLFCDNRQLDVHYPAYYMAPCHLSIELLIHLNAKLLQSETNLDKLFNNKVQTRQTSKVKPYH